jgi:hypothetical protein
MGAWQPIDSIPLNGELVLLYQPGKAIVVGYLSQALGYGIRTVPGDKAWHPTFWQPLPAPPAAPPGQHDAPAGEG